jgi:hypothetical protein
MNFLLIRSIDKINPIVSCIEDSVSLSSISLQTFAHCSTSSPFLDLQSDFYVPSIL